MFWDFTENFKTCPLFLKECQDGGFLLLFMINSVKKRLMQTSRRKRRSGNVCGPVADSYIRLAFVYSAHPSCSPSVFFTHHSPKYIPLEKPLEKIPPSSTQHAKNILSRPPFQPPSQFGFLSVQTPVIADPLICSFLALNTSSLSQSVPNCLVCLAPTLNCPHLASICLIEVPPAVPRGFLLFLLT